MLDMQKDSETGTQKDHLIRSSYKERRENALASGAEEGRDKLRKATRSRK